MGAIKNVSSTSNSLMYLTTHSKHFNAQIWEWSTWSIAGALVVCLMRVPSDTNLKNLTRSRLKWRNDGYFRPTNFKFHYVAPQFFIFRRTVQIAPNFRHWNAHIILFWLNPTRHSKFHNTPKHRFRSDCSYSLVPVGAAGPRLSPLSFFSCSGERNRRRPVSVRVTGVRYNNLFLMGTLNTLTWPDLDIFKHFIYGYVALDIGRLSRPSNARSIPFSDYLLISWFVFARIHTHTHTHTQSYVCGALKWGHLKRKHLTGQLLDRMHQPFIFSERKKWRILHLLLLRLLFLRGTFNAFHLRL